MTVTGIQTLSEVVESKITHDQPVKSSMKSWSSDNWRRVFAELLSTSLLVLLGCMACMPEGGTTSIFRGALGFGMTVMFNIQIFGHISGAHMNPVVTLSSMILRLTSVPLGIAYMIVQCIGAIAGYALLDALTTMNFKEEGMCLTTGYTGQSALQTIGIEIFLTAILVFVCCALWDPVNKEKTETVAIKFGLTILGLSIIGGPLTGASMNPARSLGPALLTNIWTDHWQYWVGPPLGSILATVIYKFIFLRKSQD